MKNLNKIVDALKNIFGEEVRVDGNQIAGTPIYIEFTEERIPNLVQLFSTAENQRTKRSDSRMIVVMCQPKYGVPMACISIDDLVGLFGALRDTVVEEVDEDEDDEEEDEAKEEVEEEPVTAQKLPVDPPAPVSETGIPLPTEVPESVKDAMAGNISEPDEPEKATNA